MKGYLAGFDIGGTKLAIVLADSKGIIYELKEEIDTESENFAAYNDGLAYYGLADQMKRLLHKALKKTKISKTKIAAIGIGSAGPLSSGAIKNSTNIKIDVPKGWEDKPLYIPLVEPLKEEFTVPIRLENDCTAAVLGEVYYGIGKKKDKSELHIVYVTLSTGFGAGVWDGGHLLVGKHGNAAEVGHFFVKEHGLKCGCGNYGCAEAYCSGKGIAKNARIKLINKVETQNGYGSIIKELATEAKREREKEKRYIKESSKELLEFVSAPIVFAAAKAGDKLAQEVLQEAYYYGGIAFANIANAYDPQVIIVGGALALENPEIITPIKEEMERHLFVEPPRIKLTSLGYKVVEYGAIVLAREALSPRARSSHGR